MTSVHAVAQDRQGFIWLGTALGLVRFDGFDFTVIGTPPDPRLRTTVVNCLRADRQGGLWFGLDRSGAGYRSAEGRWRTAQAPGSGFDWDVSCLLATRKEGLWLAGTRCARQLPEGRRLEAIPGLEDRRAVSLCEDSEGRIWLGTPGDGLFCYQNGKLTEVLASVFGSRIVNAIAQDGDGALWFGTQDGLLCLDRQLRPVEVPFPANEIHCLLIDKHGVLWAGTTGAGLIRRSRGQISALKKTDGLTSDTVLNLAEDQEGSLWIATRQGLNQLTDVKFPTLSRPDGIPTDSVLSVSASLRDGLWLGSEDGAIHLGSDGATVYSTNNAGLRTPYVKRAFESRSGDVYLVSGRREVQILAEGRVVATHATPDMAVAFAEDSEGVVVSASGDLFRISRQGLLPYPFKHGAKPPLYWIGNLSNGREDSIWVASVNGICRVKGGEFQQWTPKAGEDLIARSICEEADGTVWIALRTGIARLRDNRIQHLGRQEGLLEPNTCTIIADDRGYLWVDTYRGLSRLKKTALEDFFAGKSSRVDCEMFNYPAAVLPAEKFGYKQEMTACRTRDGRIWFPGSKGVIVVDPAHVPANRVAPPVRIHRIRDNGVEVDLKKPGRLAPGPHQLDFAYAALSFVSPQQLRFRYKLEGLDADWIEAGASRQASYANLDPGAYVFRVIACNQDGVWNENGDAVQLELLPYFYQTAWFYLLCGIAGTGTLLAVFKWRLRHLTRQQQALQQARDLLERRVEERTAELEAQKTRLEREVEERKLMQLELQQTHEELMTVSRQAGQAEVASSVLHNVGNVLNSVNVSACVLEDRVRKLKAPSLAKVAGLLQRHQADLPRFLTEDEQGRKIPVFIQLLATQLGAEQAGLLSELKDLGQNVDHIKQIVAMQQSYSKVSGVLEKSSLTELVEATLKMYANSFLRHSIELKRQYGESPPVLIDKHKLLQILINLIQNAKRACDDSGHHHKEVRVRIRQPAPDRASIEIEDNGVGIPPDNLTRIFAHGFTTRKNGHGFGLHSAALAAREMGGSLTANSPGPGQGATFILDLPLQPPTPGA